MVIAPSASTGRNCPAVAAASWTAASVSPPCARRLALPARSSGDIGVHPLARVGACVGQALARIENAGRVEHRLDAPHGVELGLAVLAAERVQLLETDAVLA